MFPIDFLFIFSRQFTVRAVNGIYRASALNSEIQNDRVGSQSTRMHNKCHILHVQ